MYSKLPILALASAAIAAPVSDSSSTPDISSLLGGSGLSGLTGILGGSGGSGGLGGLTSLLSGAGGAGGLGGLTSILGGLPIVSGLTGSLGLKAREIADLENFLDDVIQFEKRQSGGLLGGSGSDGLLGIVDGLPLVGKLVGGLGLKERQDSSDAGLGDLLDLSDIENLIAGLPIAGSLLSGLTNGLNVRQDSSDSGLLGGLLSELGLGDISSTVDNLPIAGSLLSSLNVRQDASDSDLLGGLLGGLNLGGSSGLLSPVTSIVDGLPVVGGLGLKERQSPSSDAILGGLLGPPSEFLSGILDDLSVAIGGLTSGLGSRDVADVDSMLNAFGISDVSSDAEISNLFSELPILGELFPQN